MTAIHEAFHVPPRNQGQIVEVAYAQVDGMVIRRTYDASDGSTEFAVSRARDDDEGDYWNQAPANKRWRKISGAQARWMQQRGKAS